MFFHTISILLTAHGNSISKKPHLHLKYAIFLILGHDLSSRQRNSVPRKPSIEQLFNRQQMGPSNHRFRTARIQRFGHYEHKSSSKLNLKVAYSRTGRCRIRTYRNEKDVVESPGAAPTSLSTSKGHPKGGRVFFCNRSVWNFGQVRTLGQRDSNLLGWECLCTQSWCVVCIIYVVNS